MSVEIISFSGKARTLEALRGRIDSAHFCDQEIILFAQWIDENERAVESTLSRFHGKPLAVRSSAMNEDTATTSNAGVHTSLIDVPAVPHRLRAAIDEVFRSYGEPKPVDEVLIQPMVENVAVAGVLFTRDLDTGSPYYVVNYDDYSGRTDTVTGGAESKTILVHRSRRVAVSSRRFNKLIDAVVDIETATGSDALDIEFCIDTDERIYILQVRPLTVESRWSVVPDAAFDAILDDARRTVAQGMAPQPGIAGETTIFGEMPDWNPAEIIGTSPRPLAMSLYRDLITDHVWADARAAMGYRHVPAPLMVDIAGRPYIDVRLSLNSFLPAETHPALAERLIDAQIDRLDEHPGAHDKIEFEIALTCHDFDPTSMRERLTEYGLDTDEADGLVAQLHRLTHDALDWHSGRLQETLSLSRRLLAEGRNGQDRPSADIQYMLDRCRRLGTLPFSQLARHGFITVALLRSLVRREIIDENMLEAFMRGVHTVASGFVDDFHRLHGGDIATEDFLRRYGHLRPGTYDILSWRYDERPDMFLDHSPPPISSSDQALALGAEFDAALDRMARETEFDLDAAALRKYMVTSIEAREESKFAFTKCISDVLVMLREWGEKRDLSREQVSFLPIDVILHATDLGEIRDIAARNEEIYNQHRQVRLPHLISHPQDVDVVRLPLGRPTFVTMKSVTGAPILLDSHGTPEVADKIVLIESADPGFDWIFSRGIRGLVTKFGGSNSHMAIRCAEFGLPAAIGCGERLFETLTNARVVDLDCASHRVAGH